jgi:uncharacterized protein YktB (UPF0637 family)
MTSFSGFEAADFAVFAIPDFFERMSAIRMRIRPKLLQLGDDLAPVLSRAVGHDIYPHVASHARRRVNPPDDTWVAFSRSARGYKRFAHFAVGLSLQGVYVRYQVKPEGEDDKPGLLRFLREQGPGALALAETAPVYWYRDDHGQSPTPVADLGPEQFARLLREVAVKSHGFTVGIALDAADPVVRSAALVSRATNALLHLVPLYQGTLAAAMAIG